MKEHNTHEHTFQWLWHYWQQRHAKLDHSHEAWLRQHAQVKSLKKGEVVHYENQEQEYCYIVVEGLLIKEQYCSITDKRQILSIARPKMAFFSTRHPYSQTTTLGDIRALRISLIIQIPYHAIQPYRPQDAGIETLMNIFIHKKKYQQDILHQLLFVQPLQQRCLKLAEVLPDLYWSLTLQEQADLLNVSHSTAKRARSQL